MKIIFLVLTLLFMAGCSILPGKGDNPTLVLDSCSTICEKHFVIHSQQDNLWIEALVFQSETPLLNTGILKNTSVKGKTHKGVRYSSKNSLLIFVPIEHYINNEGLEFSIYYQSSDNIRLKLRDPDVMVEPTR